MVFQEKEDDNELGEWQRGEQITNRFCSYEKEEFSGLGGKSRIAGKIMSFFWRFLEQSR